MLVLCDSRRLTGPNLFWGRPGAVLQVAGSTEEVAAVTAAWEGSARRILDAVGWTGETIVHRVSVDSANLVLSAPVDALFAATNVNEWAFEAARREVSGAEVPSLEKAAGRLRSEIARESNPSLLRLRRAADERGVTFLSDEECCSVGTGTGSLSFDVREIPDFHDVDWSRVHDVPQALVTGTNGKSTTVRAIASMVEAAGKVPGVTTTDGIRIGDEIVEHGDYSGPEGARRVLRDPRVEVAVLETARGGMLRRGLGVTRADVAAVLNVAEDHLGEFGVDTLEDLVETKLIVRHAVEGDGVLVLNLDDPSLAAWQGRAGWRADVFSMDPSVAGEIGRGMYGEAGAWLEDDALVLWRGGSAQVVTWVSDVPMTLDGAARYNVANALAAILVASRLGLAPTHQRAGLLRFAGDARANPGRTNRFDLGGVQVLADFAHNVHGLRALLDMVSRLGGRRTLIILGQSGDRDDASTREMCRIAWAARPDRIVIKEMTKYLRGRAPGEVADLIEAELRRAGAGDDVLGRSDSEMEAVREALVWAREDDLLLLLLHADRDAVLDLLRDLQISGWRPGRSLPAPHRPR